MVLKGKKITVGITGGITAYKAAEIVSWLRSCGAEVRVAMTASACQLIAPLTLKALSGHPVAVDMMDTSADWHVPHIDLVIYIFCCRQQPILWLKQLTALPMRLFPLLYWLIMPLLSVLRL